MSMYVSERACGILFWKFTRSSMLFSCLTSCQFNPLSVNRRALAVVQCQNRLIHIKDWFTAPGMVQLFHSSSVPGGICPLVALMGPVPPSAKLPEEEVVLNNIGFGAGQETGSRGVLSPWRLEFPSSKLEVSTGTPLEVWPSSVVFIYFTVFLFICKVSLCVLKGSFE